MIAAVEPDFKSRMKDPNVRSVPTHSASMASALVKPLSPRTNLAMWLDPQALHCKRLRSCRGRANARVGSLPEVLAVVITSVDFFPDDGKVALRRAQRIGLPRKPIEGTSTSASRVPVNRKCFAGSSYFTASPLDFQTILKVIRAAWQSSPAPASAADRISSVNVFSSALTVSPRSGTGTTHYSPDGGIGG
jgi:hypothetical protein